MDARPPKVTKEVLCEEARFILANVLAEGRYGRQNKLADIKRICEGAVSIPFGEYVTFLESAGYLTHDREQDTLDVTSDGERVVTGERLSELLERAVVHFKNRRAPGGGTVSRQTPVVTTGVTGTGSLTSDRAPHASQITGGLSARGEIRGTAPPPRYEKVGIIGSGGIGTVYLARQVPLDREVAVKEIRDVFAFFSDDGRREIVRRFGEVIRAAARLSHPNVVAIYDVAERDVPYVVTELMPQGSVRRLIADAEEIPVGLAVKYLLQALHALRAAHGQGLAHRGLKPENLLIDAHGNLKVSDFGMARIVERDQAVIKQVYVGMGSVAYMAPELFNDPAASGTQGDIYALGIIFYELLTRKLPGRRSPMPSVVDPSLPKGIDDIFDRMTRDERGERYEKVEDILVDFHKIEGMDKLIEGQYAVLFGDNPLAKLTFKKPFALVTDAPREVARERSTPVPAGKSSPTPPPASAAAAEDPVNTTQTGVTESVPPGAADEPSQNGNGDPQRRALSRRPYSYQQRLKDRGS